MEHRLSVGEQKTLLLCAKQVYSQETLVVNPDETYLFFCDDDQSWTDWFIKTTPKGFFNILASIQGLRLKKIKCFCLCGAYNQSDAGAFAIGMRREVTMQEAGNLSFFANDTPGYYENNKGSINVNIERVR
jgi:hypothetical protein